MSTFIRKAFQLLCICLVFVSITSLLINCDDATEPDTTVPTVTITQPVNGTVLTAPVSIKVNATDNETVEKVSFLIDGEIIGEDSLAPYEC